MTTIHRLPDRFIRVLDRRFEPLCTKIASIECLYRGTRWSEGAVWFGDGRYLLWSDIPNNRVLRWEEATGAVSIFRQPSNNANGHTRDCQGRLITCEGLTHAVTRTEYDGAITVLADRYQGKRMNSPNDVVVKSDGSIWFSDPTFGIESFYAGERREQELPMCVYRIDGHTGGLRVVRDSIQGPNGLVFSPDESILYVVASRGKPRSIYSFDVSDDGRKLSNGRTVIDAGDGMPDGLRVDVYGNLWCAWGTGTDELDGVRVFTTRGEAIGHIALPECCTNVCFGGAHRNRLFMTATSGRYALYVNTQGVKGG